MSFDKPYEEIINRYSLDELNGVKKRIDANAHPDRYELVLKEIEKRKDGIGPEVVIKEDLKRSLQARPHAKSRRIKDIPSFIITCIFCVGGITYYFYRSEIEQQVGAIGSLFGVILLIFGIYFGRKAFDE